MEGIYLLEIQVDSVSLKIGALGRHSFDGRYLYVGSALGPGGYKRVRRHLEVNRGFRNGNHWHIDSLLNSGAITRFWLLPTSRSLECSIARSLLRHFPVAVEGFGSSDCKCKSHLVKLPSESHHRLPSILNDLEEDLRPFSFEPDSGF